MTYIYLSTDWPQFAWNAELVVPRLSATRYEQGLLLGRMKGLGYQLKNEATLVTLTEETVKSSAIEGEELDPGECPFFAGPSHGSRSRGHATRRQKRRRSRRDDARRHTALRVSSYRRKNFGWHAALFPTGRSGMRKIKTGAWREGPMKLFPDQKERKKFISKLRNQSMSNRK